MEKNPKNGEDKHTGKTIETFKRSRKQVFDIFIYSVLITAVMLLLSLYAGVVKRPDATLVIVIILAAPIIITTVRINTKYAVGSVGVSINSPLSRQEYNWNDIKGVTLTARLSFSSREISRAIVGKEKIKIVLDDLEKWSPHKGNAVFVNNKRLVPLHLDHQFLDRILGYNVEHCDRVVITSLMALTPAFVPSMFIHFMGGMIEGEAALSIGEKSFSTSAAPVRIRKITASGTAVIVLNPINRWPFPDTEITITPKKGKPAKIIPERVGDACALIEKTSGITVIKEAIVLKKTIRSVEGGKQRH